jgi:palmitoyltransferase
VTRWKKYWLYGDKVLGDDQDGADRVRGWFPRRCAVDVVDNTSDSRKQANGKESKKKK